MPGGAREARRANLLFSLFSLYPLFSLPLKFLVAFFQHSCHNIINEQSLMQPRFILKDIQWQKIKSTYC